RSALASPDAGKVLRAPVAAHDRHGRAEMHLAAIAGRSDELRARPPRRPVAQVARRTRQRGAVVRRLSSGVLLLETRDLGLDAGEPVGGHEVWMRRNRPLRQLFDRVFQLFDECSAHESALAATISPGEPAGHYMGGLRPGGEFEGGTRCTTPAGALSGTISLKKSSFPLDAGIAFPYAAGNAELSGECDAQRVDPQCSHTDAVVHRPGRPGANCAATNAAT